MLKLFHEIKIEKIKTDSIKNYILYNLEVGTSQKPHSVKSSS